MRKLHQIHTIVSVSVEKIFLKRDEKNLIAINVEDKVSNK